MRMKQQRRPAATLLAACVLLTQVAGAGLPSGDDDGHPHPVARAEAQGTLSGRTPPPGSSTAQQPGNTARIELSTFKLDETTPDFRGEPAGADVRIYVDKQFIARGNDAGLVSLEVPAGEFELTALIPSTAIATVAVSIDAGQSRAIVLILDDSKEVVSPATVVVDGMIGDLLPRNFHTFGIRLFGASAHRPVQYISEIAIEDVAGNVLLPLGDLFIVDKAGNMLPADIAALRAALLPYAGQRLVLKAQGEDALGITLTARRTLLVAGDGL